MYISKGKQLDSNYSYVIAQLDQLMSGGCSSIWVHRYTALIATDRSTGHTGYRLPVATYMQIMG